MCRFWQVFRFLPLEKGGREYSGLVKVILNTFSRSASSVNEAFLSPTKETEESKGGLSKV